VYKSGRFKIRDHNYLFSRARLYADRLVLQGWSWRGRYKRIVPLQSIKEVIWWTGAAHINLELRFHENEQFVFWISEAEPWKLAIENRIAIFQNQDRVPDQKIESSLAEAPAMVHEAW
jgi:hypothetical protein